MANDTDTQYIVRLLAEMQEQVRWEYGDDSRFSQAVFDNLKREYEKAAGAAASAEDWARYQTAFAEALPQLTQSIINANAAFRDGDTFGGTAAIMDICGTMSTFIGNLSVAGGPPGAVVGAIFSVVSMILNLFKQPPESLTEQIENMLRMIQAEELIENLEAARKDLEVFSTAIARAKPNQVETILGYMNPVSGTPFHVIRQAAHWLQNPKNYSQDLWPEMLITQCQFYAEVLLTCTLLTSKVAAFGSGASAVGFRSDPAYGQMVAAIDCFMVVIKACHPVQMTFLSAMRPLARNKGTVWHIQALAGYKSPQRLNVNLPGHSNDLGGEMEAITVAAVKTPVKTPAVKTPEGGLRRDVAVFHLEPRPGGWPWVEMGIDLLDQEAHNYWGQLTGQSMEHLDWNGTIIEFEERRTHPFQEKAQHLYGMFGDSLLAQNSGWKKPGFEVGRFDKDFYDIWATPAPEAGKICLSLASGDLIFHHKAITYDSQESRFSTLTVVATDPIPFGHRVGRVRVLRAPRPFADEDPAVLREVGMVVYGLCQVEQGRSEIPAENNRDHMELRAYYYKKETTPSQEWPEVLGEADKKGRSFLSPWRNVRGIGVDQRYLWVFRVGEIACATHTSVKECLDNKRAEPSWNTYTIPRRPLQASGHVYDGLLDLSPCDDGTLTAAVGLWSGPLYSLTPRIDRRAKKIAIDRWQPLQEIIQKEPMAFRVHKQAMVGWTLLERLMETLEKAATSFTLQQESVVGGDSAQGTIELPIPAAEDIAITFTSTAQEVIPAPSPLVLKKDTKSQVVSIPTKATAQNVVATITAVLSTSISAFQPLAVTTTLKTVPVAFTLDHSVVGGEDAHGTITLSMPAAEDIKVTFAITSDHAEIFPTPDAISILKGTKSHAVSIKTNLTAKNRVALITATALGPPPGFKLMAKLTAVAPLTQSQAAP